MKSENIKTLIFVSNFFNHHQKPLSNEFYKLLGDGFKFIETEPMPQERKSLGWGEKSFPDYVVSCDEFHNHKVRYQSMIDEADVVITGSAPLALIRNRIKSKKLIYIYSERPLKEKPPLWKHVARLFTWRRLYPQRANMNMLCASAYTALDYSRLGLFINRCYKWGYFPEEKQYDDINSLISNKKKNSILWCARFIGLKHPEIPVEIARRLKAEGYHFELNMIGNGEETDKIKDQIAEKKVDDCVHILGSMTPEAVREYMEKSTIFLFTSDRNEGWGAVLNESMNSACAVIASHAIGSVPFVIQDRENGVIYEDGNIEDLYVKIKWLLENDEERNRISKNAYKTMAEEWNATNAAKKMLLLSEKALKQRHAPDLFDDGVCSKAKILRDEWYKA